MLLYEGSIWSARMVEKKQAAPAPAPDASAAE
jgi:Sec-independent protein secretion pathway component TatC